MENVKGNVNPFMMLIKTVLIKVMSIQEIKTKSIIPKSIYSAGWDVVYERFLEHGLQVQLSQNI